MKTTASNLIRWAGLSAVPGGSLFIGIQAVHPPEALSSVTTSTWAIVHYAGVAIGGGAAVDCINVLDQRLRDTR